MNLIQSQFKDFLHFNKINFKQLNQKLFMFHLNLVKFKKTLRKNVWFINSLKK